MQFHKLFRARFLCLLCCIAAGPVSRPVVSDHVTDAKGLDYALDKLNAPLRETAPLSPADELKQFRPKAGLAVDLIASEPEVRQPLCINFDGRGRMWVVQYIQYPFPAGLKVLEYDKYIRAKFDKVPPAPPNQFPGKDVISILEDVDHDGSFRKIKTFVSGLSIATSALPGRGGRGPGDHGVWVMNAPYLLFYPDKNRDDVPDGDPIVHLSGFGLEDTHAVANNLTWGPDGWLYGCQGSTCTAKVKAELSKSDRTTDFLGQAIWRYHPETHRFEIFAEGGGNTFGLEFDDTGHAFSGTNWGKYRGLYFVQGAYYVKGWGKHGPLTNPYAFGYFEHMPHTGNADRLAHTFIVYGGGLLGPEYTGKILSPNSLRSRLQVSRLQRAGSSFETLEEPFMLTSEDGWFRPIDLKCGPDGALYVADMYERRISHVDPRDNWDRATGRIWRVRPADWKPGSAEFDLHREPTEALLKRLESVNRWERTAARVELAERGDPSTSKALHRMLATAGGQPALEALWALNAVAGLDERDLQIALGRPNAAVRRWAVRLAADAKDADVPSTVLDRFVGLATTETDPDVRSQLASTAKRLPARQALPLIVAMLSHDADLADAHIPLLLWWAIEDKAGSHSDEVVLALSDPALWRHPIASQVVFPRLARRYAAAPSPENQRALVRLIAAAPGPKEASLLFAGVKEALAGAQPPLLIPELSELFAKSGDIELSLRAGGAAAEGQAIALITDRKTDVIQRIRLIEALGQSGKSAGPALLELVRTDKDSKIRRAAMGALPHFEQREIADRLVELIPSISKDPELKSAAIAALLSRPAWALSLVRAVERSAVARADLGPAELERLRQFDDPALATTVEKVFGKAIRATDGEKSKEVDRVKRLATTGHGDELSGKALFTTRCAICHTYFNEGGKVGPDLTGYDRKNMNDMVVNIVDPSAYIREEFASFRIKTKSGEAYVGLITERSAERISLIDASQQKTTLAKTDIIDERPLSVSLMPEGLLAGLSDREIRDLFKYLTQDKPLKEQ